MQLFVAAPDSAFFREKKHRTKKASGWGVATIPQTDGVMVDHSQKKHGHGMKQIVSRTY